MAASEVIVLDTRSCVPHQPGTQRLERILEHWYKDLKANVVVSIDRSTFGTPSVSLNSIFTGSSGSNVICLRADLVAVNL